MSKLNVLYTANEIDPFLTTSSVARVVRQLAQHMHGVGINVRILVPKFGVISERRNNLHEVVRLSGANITLGTVTQPVTIKVASIPQVKLQVYFIDNTDLFKRKFVLHDQAHQFYADNDERMIFFCQGALETVKRLSWSPDIIHCHGWFTSLIPMYLKTAYRDEDIYHKTKSVFTLYNHGFSHQFGNDFSIKAAMPESPSHPHTAVGFTELMKLGVQYADSVTYTEPLEGAHFKDWTSEKEIHHITSDPLGCTEYHDLYQQLAQLT